MKHQTDKLSYLWLALAFGILAFANGLQIIPVAAWLGPIFLVRYLRTQKLFPGLLFGYIVTAATFYIQWSVAFKDAGAMFSLYTGIFGLLLYIPYLLDRLITPRLPRFLATLVFPVSMVVIEYVLHFILPLGTFFSIAYTQAENLPLLQIAAVTGHWGITFLVVWLAGIVNYVWEAGFEMKQVRPGMVFYGLIMFLVMFGGGLRLAVFCPLGETVQVAAMNSNTDEEVIPEPESVRGTRLLEGTLTTEDVEDMSRIMTAANEDLLERTRIQAQAGTEIITWTEYGAHVWRDEEAVFLAEVQSLAREEEIFLAFPLTTIEPDPAQRIEPSLIVENKSVMVTSQGEVAYEYMKHNLLIGWESEHAVRGPRIIEVIDSPYGRLSSVICLDMEYPAFMQLARAGYRGQIIVVDYQGRMLSRVNHTTAVDRVAVGQVPVKGVWTPYSMLGDYFPVICVLKLAVVSV